MRKSRDNWSPPYRPPGHAAEAEGDDEAEVLTRQRGQVKLDGVARMAGDLARMLGGQRPAARQQMPPWPADEVLLPTAVISPARPAIPEAPASAEPVSAGKELVRAKPPGRQSRQADPEYGSHLVPHDGKLAPPCAGCRSETRRAATWTRASWQLEMLAGAIAVGFPAVLDLCGNHVRQVPAEIIAVRRRWAKGKWVLASPSLNGSRAPGSSLAVAAPNRTIALSGFYG